MDDVSEATWRLAKEAPIGETYHISTNRIVSIRELVEMLCQMLGVDFEQAVDVAPERLGKDSAYWLNSDKMRRLGWQDHVTLEAGLAVYKGKPLVNSVTGEEERLEQVLPLIKKYGAAVVAISNDETGISEDPDVRFAVAKKIVERAADYGIPHSDIVVDPLVMPIGAINTAGRQVFALLKRLREELKVNTTCGASNVSFGLPQRNGINSAFLTMAIGAGMTSAITNPMHEEIMAAVMGADVMMGHDPDCRRWIRKFRDPNAGGEGEGGARGRREGRRRRPAAG